MPSLHTWLCERAILPLGDLLTGQRVTHYLKHYLASQYLPPEVLAAQRDRAIAETVRIAHAEVPFYRELYDTCGVSPADIRGLADLPRLPIVTKRMLRAAFPARCTRSTGYRWADYTTSGSTGTPFAVRVDNDSMSRARALMFLRALFGGYVIGEPLLMAGTSPDRGRLKAFKDLVLRVEYISTYDMTPRTLDRCLETMDCKRIKHLGGQGQGLYMIAKRANEVGYNRPLASCLSWGSILLPEYREAIRQAFACCVTDSYGIGEGIQIGSQCPECGDDFHQFSQHVAVEFCRDGEPVPRGERGEIILTRLDAGTMPLIRYQVGDVGSQSLAEDCACGRTLPRIGPVAGRTSDIIVTPAGNQLIVHFFTSLFGKVRSIASFQIQQECEGGVHVLIVPRPEFKEEDWLQLRDQIQRKGDPDLDITMETVDEIPVEASGKRRFIKSQVGFK